MPLPAWHPHYDVWAVVFVLVFAYWYADLRLRPLVAPDSDRPTRTQVWQWHLAVVALWLVSDWPLHDLAETSLFTLHMVEHMVLAFVVPPLLLMGTPRWLADATIGRPGVARWLRPLAKAVPAFVIFNATFIVIHWPDLVTLMLTSNLAHFAIHGWLMAVSILMWLPVLSPTPAIPRLRPPIRMLYLFFHSLLPTVPASFLTFTSVQVYMVYGNASLAYGLTPIADTQLSGIVMKLGGGLLLWVTIAFIWARWTREEREWEELETSLRAG